MAQRPPVGQGLLFIGASRWHSDTWHSVGLLWKSDQSDTERPLPDETQHSQQTDIHAYIHAHGGIPSKQTAVVPLFKPCDAAIGCCINIINIK